MFTSGVGLNHKHAMDLEVLRTKVRLMESGTSRVHRQRVSSGWEELDAQIGGLPRPGLMELRGPMGSGRTRIVFRFIAATTTRGQRVAWVDSEHTLYPPVALQQDLDPRHWALIRPSRSSDDDVAWVVEQLLRSGCFPLVLVDVPRAMTLRHIGYRWARASEQGGSTAILLTQRPYRGLPVEVRLQVGGGGVRILKDRDHTATGGRKKFLFCDPLWR